MGEVVADGGDRGLLDVFRRGKSRFARRHADDVDPLRLQLVCQPGDASVWDSSTDPIFRERIIPRFLRGRRSASQHPPDVERYELAHVAAEPRDLPDDARVEIGIFFVRHQEDGGDGGQVSGW